VVLLLTGLQETGSKPAEAVISAAFVVISGKENVMLHYAVVFFVIALVAALFGFGGIAAGAAEIAKILFFIFLVLFVVSLIVGLLRK
jgi:uncharacterized membrane protein YtjA (UPF0391 family)